MELEFGLGVPSAESWRYSFTKDALVDDEGERRLILGLWDRMFGAWELRRGRPREIVPSWRMFRRNGSWRDPVEVFSDLNPHRIATWPAKRRHHARAAFTAFFSSIPAHFRALVGPMKWHQWIALDLIWQEPEFAGFLERELFNGNGQYVYAALALASAHRQSRARRRSLARAIMRRPRHEVIAGLAGAPRSKPMLRALSKLDAEPHSGVFYRRLADVLEDPERVKLLAHAEAFNAEAVYAVADLGPEFVRPNVIPLLGSGERFLACVRDIERRARHRSPDIRARIGQSLGQVRTIPDLLRWHERWEGRLAGDPPFPPPPIPGNDTLRPLISAHAMRAEARNMQNCIHTYIDPVLDEEAYFYHWHGPEPSTVMLGLDDDGGAWQCAEILGFDNAVVTDRTERYVGGLIERQLRDSPPLSSVWKGTRAPYRRSETATVRASKFSSLIGFPEFDPDPPQQTEIPS